MFTVNIKHKIDLLHKQWKYFSCDLVYHLLKEQYVRSVQVTQYITEVNFTFLPLTLTTVLETVFSVALHSHLYWVVKLQPAGVLILRQVR